MHSWQGRGVISTTMMTTATTTTKSRGDFDNDDNNKNDDEDGNNMDDDKESNGDDGEDARTTVTSFLTQQLTSGLEGMPQSPWEKFFEPCDIRHRWEESELEVKVEG